MNSTQKKFNELLNAIPDEVNQYVELQGDIAVRIGKIIDKKDWTQKKLAAEMKWNESQVTRLLAGHENLTLKTIAKLSTVLGEPLIQVAGKKADRASSMPASIHANPKVVFHPGILIAGSEYIQDIQIQFTTGDVQIIRMNQPFSIPNLKFTKSSNVAEKKVA